MRATDVLSKLDLTFVNLDIIFRAEAAIRSSRPIDHERLCTILFSIKFDEN